MSFTQKPLTRRGLAAAAITLPAVLATTDAASAAEPASTGLETPGGWTVVDTTYTGEAGHDPARLDSPQPGGITLRSDLNRVDGHTLQTFAKQLHVTPGTTYRFTISVQTRRTSGPESSTPTPNVYFSAAVGVPPELLKTPGMQSLFSGRSRADADPAVGTLVEPPQYVAVWGAEGVGGRWVTETLDYTATAEIAIFQYSYEFFGSSKYAGHDDWHATVDIQKL